MVLKVAKRLVQVPCRYLATHHMVLPADTFEGKVIPKTRVVNKDRVREHVKYGGRHIVTMLPGAAPGPKLMSYVKDVFKTANVPVDFEEIPYEGTEDEEKTALFGHLSLTSMHRNGVGIKGNIVNPNEIISSNVALRHELDLYVCVVRIKSYPHVKCEYAMLEHSAKPGIVESLKIITAENTARFAEWCFEFALQENRKKVTIVHKANIMKLSDGLFMKVVKDVARNFPQIQVTDMIVDNATMQMVQDPTQFDMVVTPNLYGNILSNIACGLVGGAGLMSGRNFGPNCALFEAGSRHLTFLDDDNLNPTAMLNASIDMLHYLGKSRHADLINKAITKTLSVDRVQTHDIGGVNSSDEMIDKIKQNLKEFMKNDEHKLF
ncbi:unnamed protein product [Ceutorhynchus assimilis]|uniref:Isopropylmalate dehydrogenase-like domain-containing protein n=1 Tax=Ceutorhynchus assimilis TaxID=467358 RepID=A0A9N9MTC9_9CUCU|nr:unnamed protein product [Ceutorhynchus assimilis]